MAPLVVAYFHWCGTSDHQELPKNMVLLPCEGSITIFDDVPPIRFQFPYKQYLRKFEKLRNLDIKDV